MASLPGTLANSALEKHLTFTLGGCEYAIVITHVREIIAMHEITPLPKLPDYVKGVFNLRGKIIPVMDLRLRLGLDSCEYGPATCIVVTELQGDEERVPDLVGCIVDSVSDVRDILMEEVQTVPRTERWSTEEHVEGLVQCEDGVVAVLSIAHVLGDVFSHGSEALLDLDGGSDDSGAN